MLWFVLHPSKKRQGVFFSFKKGNGNSQGLIRLSNNLYRKRFTKTKQIMITSLKEARKGFFGCYSVCETMKDTKEGYFIM